MGRRNDKHDSDERHIRRKYKEKLRNDGEYDEEEDKHERRQSDRKKRRRGRGTPSVGVSIPSGTMGYDNDVTHRRRARIAQRVREEVTDRLRDVDNKNFGFVTVTDCLVSPDLRHAKILVSIMGEEEEKQKGILILKQLFREWRGSVGRALGIKTFPELHAELDDRIDRMIAMEQLINEARATDSDPTPLSPEEMEKLLTASKKVGLSPVVARLASQAKEDEEEKTKGLFIDPDELDEYDDEYEEFHDEDEEDDDDKR